MNNGKHVTLTLTECCNLNCVYCYEDYKSDKRMSFETAVSILEKELRNSQEYDYVEVAFHGGEPLLEFDLLRDICEWVWDRTYDCNYYFFATTNGTLLSEEMKEWFSRNRDRIMLGLSLDGTKEVQNHNRSNSYDMIDLAFFKELWPNQPVKMTISDYTVGRLAESVIHAHKCGFKVSANFAFGIDWTATDLDQLDDELEKLVEYYAADPSVEPCSLIGQKFELAGTESRRWCGAGKSMRVYDTEGNLFPCHYFMGFAIGEAQSEKSMGIDFTNDELFRSDDCNGCAVYPICPTCYGYNYASTGSVSKRDKGLCTLTKHCAAAGSMLAYLRLSRFSNEDLGIDEDKKKRMLNGIAIIQEYLDSEL